MRKLSLLLAPSHEYATPAPKRRGVSATPIRGQDSSLVTNRAPSNLSSFSFNLSGLLLVYVRQGRSPQSLWIKQIYEELTPLRDQDITMPVWRKCGHIYTKLVQCREEVPPQDYRRVMARALCDHEVGMDAHLTRTEIKSPKIIHTSGPRSLSQLPSNTSASAHRH